MCKSWIYSLLISKYLYDDGKILSPKRIFVPLVFLISVVAGSGVHYFESFSFSIDIRCIDSLWYQWIKLSSLVLKMVTLSAHTISLAMLYQLFITLCEKELRRTVLTWISSCFMGDIGYFNFVQSKSNWLFSILYKIIMSKRCQQYSNILRVAIHI